MTPHPALAPSGPRELAQLATDWTGDMPEGGALIEEKVDGFRALWIDGELVTREGAPLHSIAHISATLSGMETVAGEPMMFDGEFQAGGSFDGTVAHQAQRGRADDAGTLHLFDGMTMAEWRAGGTERPLWARKAELAALMSPIAELSPVRLVSDQWAVDPADVRAMASEVYARGGEGVMVKDATLGYRRNRNSSWRKVKRALRLELPVVAVICGDDNLARAVAVRFGDRQLRIPVRDSDAARRRIFDAQLGMVGSLALVGAMERTSKGVLRQPYFIGMA